VLRSSYEPGRFAVWTFMRQGPRVLAWRDGEPASVRAADLSRGTTLNLGLLFGQRPQVQNLKGELAELLVYSNALSDNDRVAVEQYLGRKYALPADK
jgi:hypothetical protein